MFSRHKKAHRQSASSDFSTLPYDSLESNHQSGPSSRPVSPPPTTNDHHLNYKTIAQITPRSRQKKPQPPSIMTESEYSTDGFRLQNSRYVDHSPAKPHSIRTIPRLIDQSIVTVLQSVLLRQLLPPADQPECVILDLPSSDSYLKHIIITRNLIQDHQRGSLALVFYPTRPWPSRQSTSRSSSARYILQPLQIDSTNQRRPPTIRERFFVGL